MADRARAAGLEARWGRKVLELRPPVEADKGTAVLHLLGERGLRRAASPSSWQSRQAICHISTSAMSRPAACAKRNAPVRFVSITRDQRSGGNLG